MVGWIGGCASSVLRPLRGFGCPWGGSCGERARGGGEHQCCSKRKRGGRGEGREEGRERGGRGGTHTALHPQTHPQTPKHTSTHRQTNKQAHTDRQTNKKTSEYKASQDDGPKTGQTVQTLCAQQGCQRALQGRCSCRTCWFLFAGTRHIPFGTASRPSSGRLQVRGEIAVTQSFETPAAQRVWVERRSRW